MQSGEERQIEGLRQAMRLLMPGGLAIAATMLLSAPAALAGKAMQVTDRAQLHPIAGGDALTEMGKATGTLPGTVRVTLKIHQYTASSSFTIQTSRGSISGKGVGKLKTGKGTYASFGGAISVTGGTGAYKHAHGKGGLYGTINRRDDAMTVAVSGLLHL
jgi:hypothetical protein